MLLIYIHDISKPIFRPCTPSPRLCYVCRRCMSSVIYCPISPSPSRPSAPFQLQVGFGAWISAGAVVLPRVRVGSWCFVGPNASVEQDVAANCRAVGVPAVVTEGQGTKPADFSDCSEESTPVAANVMLLSASSPSRGVRTALH